MDKPLDRTVGEFYGPWSWVVGFAFGGALMWLMFALADGFL